MRNLSRSIRNDAILMIWAAFVVSLVMFHSPSWALNSEVNRATLRGLPGVRVLVEDLAPLIEQEGLVKDYLQTEVEKKLRKAGIKVLTQEECLRTPGEPYLYIILNLNPIRPVGDFFSYSIDVGVIQNVTLQRHPQQKTYAITWSTGGVGSVEKQFLRKLQESVEDLVGLFVDAYRSVNPKK